MFCLNMEDNPSKNVLCGMLTNAKGRRFFLFARHNLFVTIVFFLSGCTYDYPFEITRFPSPSYEPAKCTIGVRRFQLEVNPADLSPGYFQVVYPPIPTTVRFAKSAQEAADTFTWLLASQLRRARIAERVVMEPFDDSEVDIILIPQLKRFSLSDNRLWGLIRIPLSIWWGEYILPLQCRPIDA